MLIGMGHRRPARLLVLVALLSALPFLVVGLWPGAFYVVMAVAPYLVFHNVTEFFSVMVSLSVFGLGWFSYARSRDLHALFLSTAFLAIGLMDFMHALGYAGMPEFFTPNTVNRASQLWVFARLVTALTFVVGAFLPPEGRTGPPLRFGLLAGALGLTGLVFTGVVFFPSLVPTTFVPGVGLTPFKVGAEYLIIGLLVVALVAYRRKMARTEDGSILYLLAAFVLCIFSELVFTLYKSAYDTYNMLGHVYKVLAFFLVYRSLYVSSIHRPYDQLKEANERLHRENAERTQAEAEVRRALEEKETLVRELYHRTKNTIQVVRGMLVLQAAEIPEDGSVRKLVAKTEERIEAIVQVHDLLYSSHDLSRIPARTYVRNLAELLVRQTGNEGDRIRLHLEVEELPILLDTAVPFGLILNELLTNSLRWAFPEGRPGSISVRLVRGAPGRVQFSYQDDGVGLPEGFSLEDTSTLGLTLVHSLATQQMLGRVQVTASPGFGFSLEFPDTLYGARV